MFYHTMHINEWTWEKLVVYKSLKHIQMFIFLPRPFIEKVMPAQRKVVYKSLRGFPALHNRYRIYKSVHVAHDFIFIHHIEP